MNTCHCGGNNSLRKALGTIRCECGGSLTTMQVLYRIIDRLNDLDEGETRLIGALQRLGADRCDRCGDWDTDTWHWGDRCWCKRCLEFNQDGPITEEDDEDVAREVAVSLVAFLTGRGIKVNQHSEILRLAYADYTGRHA